MRHRQQKDRQAEKDGHYKTLHHIPQFPSPGVIRCGIKGLKRHAALGTITRPPLPHLGVHRTGVDGILTNRL